MRGRPPKHPALRIAEGNPGHRDVPEAPVPGAGAPEPPDWLAEEAAAEWQRVVPLLEASGVLAQVDRGLLVTYCEAWADFHEATHMLRGAKTHQDEKGNERRSPWVIILKQARDAFLKAASELGCTPTARARLGSLNPNEGGDPLEDFAQKRG